MRSTMVEGDHLNRRAQRTLVLEEIEDFEHKLGWKMRKNLGEFVWMGTQHKQLCPTLLTTRSTCCVVGVVFPLVCILSICKILRKHAGNRAGQQGRVQRLQPLAASGASISPQVEHQYRHRRTAETHGYMCRGRLDAFKCMLCHG